jgi:hypothetical protein
MWEKQTTYAVKKKGGVKARNVCPTEEEANAKLAEYGKDYEIEVRLGERTRCANFCSVRPFCSQWEEYVLQQQQGLLPKDMEAPRLGASDRVQNGLSVLTQVGYQTR